MRNTSTFVTYFERRSFTNQRLNFDISLDNHLYLGNEVTKVVNLLNFLKDGTVVVYDLKDSSTKSYFQAGKESVNNVSLVYLENERKGFMVSTSGERNFSLEDTSNRIEVEDDSADEDEKVKGLFIPPSNENNLKSNVIKLWEVPYAEKVIQSNIEINSSDTVKVTEETVVTTQEVIVNETVSNKVEMVIETEQNVQITESAADKNNQIIEESL